MSRIPGAVVAALLALAALAPAAVAHGGASINYSSKIRSVDPAGAGIDVRVLDRDDRLLLTNDGDETVVVEGYDGEPYVRIAPDGTVAVNVRSPAHHLNDDRYAEVELPPTADGDAPPRWRVLDRTGRYEWHDHRIHWMVRDRPEKVADPERRTKVFDWRVPIRAGSAGAISGELYWVGRSDDGFPIAAVLALVAVVAGGLVLVVVVRRRRRAGATTDEPEAW